MLQLSLGESVQIRTEVMPFWKKQNYADSKRPVFARS